MILSKVDQASMFNSVESRSPFLSKKIIEFCVLDWEEECLNFHENKAPIKTMSTAQARKPLYKSSLNSYEKFSPYLETLNETIK